jgi:hypothetical protein
MHWIPSSKLLNHFLTLSIMKHLFSIHWFLLFELDLRIDISMHVAKATCMNEQLGAIQYKTRVFQYVIKSRNSLIDVYKLF